MKILIIEDEHASAKHLSQTLKAVDSKVEILATCEDEAQTLKAIQKNSTIDAIFSDIQLADDLSFSILKKLNPKIPIVFVTAYNHYALEAFKHHGIDYVLKPFTKDDIEKALHKLKTYHKGQSFNQNNNFYEVLEQIEKAQAYKKTFLVNFQDRLIPINTSDIAFIHTSDEGVFLTNHSAKSYKLQDNLEQLEKQLNPQEFFRANRQFIIHRNGIEDIRHYFNGRLKIKTKPQAQEDIIISKAKATEFKNWLSL